MVTILDYSPKIILASPICKHTFADSRHFNRRPFEIELLKGNLIQSTRIKLVILNTIKCE